MNQFLARRAQKAVGNKIKQKWADFRDYVLENPKEIIDNMVKKISAEPIDNKTEDNNEFATLMAKNLADVASSEGGMLLISTIADIYSQHAARKTVSNWAQKMQAFNDNQDSNKKVIVNKTKEPKVKA